MHGATIGIALRATLDDENASGWGSFANVLKLPFPDLTLADGDGTGNVNKLYVAKVTVPAGDTVTLHLTDGTLKDIGGVALVFGKMKAAAVVNAGVLALTVAGTNGLGWVDAPLPAAAVLLWASGVGIDVIAGDTVTLTNAGGAGVDVEIALLGSAT